MAVHGNPYAARGFRAGGTVPERQVLDLIVRVAGTLKPDNNLLTDNFGVRREKPFETRERG